MGPTHKPLLTGALLLLITLAVLAFHHLGPERTLRLDASNLQQVEHSSDRFNDGESSSWVQQEGDTTILHCHLREGFPWPYCQLELQLAGLTEGLDLSGFSRMELSLSLNTDTEARWVRIFLRNYDPLYANEDDNLNHKVNKVQVAPPAEVEAGPLVIELKHFRVADWWLQTHQVPIEHTVADQTSVSHIQISTGSFAPLGEYRIALNHIEFQGPWVRSEVLYGALLAMWSASVVVWLLYLLVNSRRAQRDPLTGALNRSALRGPLLYSMQRLRRANQPSCLLYMDLDHFKAINDQHGHNAGDEILSAFAKLIRSRIRSSDYFIRWGGEEFLLLCQGTSLKDGLKLAENLRHSIETADWPHDIPLTCSFGVAELTGQSEKALLEEADQALYRAKNEGRNRVASAA